MEPRDLLTTGGAESLSVAVRQAREGLGIPGIAVGLLNRASEEMVCDGVTNVEHPLPVAPDTLFQAGSITKILTATAILRLVERGTLTLDAPIRTYLPDLRLADERAAASVTLANVLTHSGGWQDLIADTGPGDDALARLVARMAALPQQTPPGMAWSYSDVGYSLLGRLLEIQTGQTYEAAVTELVLAPLGMKESFFFAADAITHAVAVGHTIRETGPAIARPWAKPRSVAPAGGLICSLRDLLRFARFHLGGGGTAPSDQIQSHNHADPDSTRLLSPFTLVAMRGPRLSAGWMADHIGLGWCIRDAGPARLIGHEGIANGQRASLLLLPERGFALALLTNGDRGFFSIREIVAWALDRYLQLPPPPALDRMLAHLARRPGGA